MKLATLVLGTLCAVLAQAQTAEDIFERYFTHAQNFADAYPREKAHLHLDNASYYVGDTIWFKAYVVTAEDNRPSRISKPLYVELVNQMGYTTEKQIIELENGEGHGQFVLGQNVLSGYYEIRAYTKWMLAFDEEKYFSRTIPIYKKVDIYNDEERSIATYQWAESANQRPVEKEKRFSVQFFPEGGTLVRGIPSVVAFKAESRDGGEEISLSGEIVPDGQKVGQAPISFRTLHDGMGYFLYTPSEQPATAKVKWKGKDYSFRLPDAMPSGYVMSVQNRIKQIEVRVMRSDTALEGKLAVFFSHQGRPITYKTVEWKDGKMDRLILPAEELPAGTLQVSLINEQGKTLADRFCYVMPRDTNGTLQARTNSPLYNPYEQVTCRLKIRDADGKPVKGRISVSIRDRRTSDYQEYDNTLYTDLLLTSDLKGYIHEPGYYFTDRSAQRQRELDVLMLIHGWRKYDISMLIGTQGFMPRYQPEKQLTLHGQIKRTIRQEAQPNITVSVFARTDSMVVAGSILADSAGYFQIPVDGFEGSMNAAFQTRMPGRKRNRMCRVLLNRNFRPALRPFSKYELNPEWDNTDGLKWLEKMADSLFTDSILGPNNHLLDEVEIKGKKRYRKHYTKRFEQSIIAYYDVEQMLDRLLDEGKGITNVFNFLKEVNKEMIYSDDKTITTKGLSYGTTKCSYNNNSAPDTRRLSYRGRPITYIINGQLDSWWQMDDLNAIKYIILCEGKGAFDILDVNKLDMGYLELIG